MSEENSHSGGESMPAVTEKKRWTYEDYCRIEDDNRYEIYRGELIMVAAPSSWHQRYSRNLEFLIWSYVREKGLGEVFYAPIDVIFSKDNVYQPDIIFVGKERADIVKERGIFGAPDLVIEILSPGTAIHDTIMKREVYEGYGVREFWLVNPDEKAIEVLILKDNVFRRHSYARKEGTVNSNVLDCFSVDLKDVFARSE